MTYYLGRKGEKLGPYSLADLQAMMARGEVHADDLAWGEGMPSWLPAAQVLGGAGSLPPVAQPAVSALSPSYPAPPPMHWALVLLITFCTCGIFSFVWMFIQAAFVKKIDPRNNAIPMFALYIGLYFVGLTTALLRTFAGEDFQTLGTVISPLAYIAAVVCLLIGIFGMRRSLETHYNSAEPIGLKLSGVMTFFFNILYFQYHFARIAAMKQPGTVT